MADTSQRVLEIRILNLLRSPTFFAESKGLVRPRLLTAEGVPIFRAIEQLHSKADHRLVGVDYKKNILDVNDVLRVVKRKRSGKELAPISDILEKMEHYRRDFSSPSVVRALYEEYRDNAVLRELMIEAGTQQENGKIDLSKLREMLEDAAPVTKTLAEPADFGSLLDRLKDNRSNRIATGFEEMDESLQGGLGIGELAVIGGYGKSGKSAVLMKIAMHEMYKHKRPVLYFTMADLHALELETRLACMLREKKEESLTRADIDQIIKWQRKHKNYFMPVDLTGRTVLPGQLESVISYTKEKHPRLRLVIIDRAESMARGSSNDQLRHRLAKVFHDIRAIAENTQTAIYVDIQTDVRSKWKSKVSWSDAHESKVDVGATLDIWIGIGRKQEDPEVRFFNLEGRRRIPEEQTVHRYRFVKETFTFEHEMMYAGEEEDG